MIKANPLSVLLMLRRKVIHKCTLHRDTLMSSPLILLLSMPLRRSRWNNNNEDLSAVLRLCVAVAKMLFGLPKRRPV
ncbi:hypothetical protein M8C21_031262, partial [Ambrosia artemisiifolia]